MKVSNVDALLAQMRTMTAEAQGARLAKPTAGLGATNTDNKVDFSQILKSSLDGVNQTQRSAEAMQNAFVLGDDKVSLSDTMIAMQKANISFQTAVQVRSKLVAAYNEVMNMPI